MCKTFEVRRRVLVGLIQDLGKTKNGFTITELIDAYRKVYGDAILDGLTTIRGFVEGLFDFGILSKNNDRFSVAQ